MAFGILVAVVQGQLEKEELGMSRKEAVNLQTTTLPIADHRVFLTPTQDYMQYLVQINIGNPEQSLNVVFDTGSTKLLLFSPTFCSNENVNTTCYNEMSLKFFRDGSTDVSNEISLDGEAYYDASAANGTDITTFPIGNAKLDASSVPVLQQQLPFLLTTNFSAVSNLPGFHSIKHMAGFLGAAPAGSAYRELTDALGTSSQIYALDLELPHSVSGKYSELHLGGVDIAYQNSMEMTEAQSDYSFKIYDISVCGSTLYQESTGKTAKIDTSSACLKLPSDIFDALPNWAPIVCETINNRQQQTQCFLPGLRFPRLPHLKFRLNRDGVVFQVDLTDLIMGPESDPNSLNYLTNNETTLFRRRLCLTRGSNATDPVVFGVRALRQLYTVLDYRPGNQAVGMASKMSSDVPAEVQCARRVPCQGMQVHQSDNTCKDPDCSEYFFLELDDTDKTCNFSAAFHTITAILIVMFLTVEFSINFFHEHLTKRVHNALTPIDSPDRIDTKVETDSKANGIEMASIAQ